MRKSGIAGYCLPVLFALELSHPQTAVNLSGTVQDGRTQAPVAGASVKLAKLGLGTQTNADGRFSLATTSAVRQPLIKEESGTSADPGVLLYRHDADGPVSIRIGLGTVRPAFR